MPCTGSLGALLRALGLPVAPNVSVWFAKQLSAFLLPVWRVYVLR